MDGLHLQADDGDDESTWRYRIRRRSVLLALNNLITRGQQFVDDDVARVGRRAWSG